MNTLKYGDAQIIFMAKKKNQGFHKGMNSLNA